MFQKKFWDALEVEVSHKFQAFNMYVCVVFDILVFHLMHSLEILVFVVVCCLVILGETCLVCISKHNIIEKVMIIVLFMWNQTDLSLLFSTFYYYIYSL